MTPEGEELARIRLEEMAMFVVHLGFKPSEYYALTVPEYYAIRAELERSTKQI